MALPTLHWRMLQPIALPSTSNLGLILDAIYTAGTSTVYADGTARVPGAGSAWTWGFDNSTLTFAGEKTACYADPPPGGALAQKFIIAGTSLGAGLNWKQMNAGGGGDARLGGYLYAGIAKNAGAYGTWNSPTTPFTSGDFSGFGYTMPIVASFPIGLLLMWECEEAIAWQLVRSGGTGQLFGGIAGAYIDPLSANLANAETDGRLYGISVTGSTANVPISWLTGSGAGSPLVNNVSAGNEHALAFNPGAGTLSAAARFGNFTPSAAFLGRNGDIPSIPLQTWNGTQYIGQLRQMFITRDTSAGIAWTVAGVVKGYIYGYATGTAGDALVLTV